MPTPPRTMAAVAASGRASFVLISGGEMKVSEEDDEWALVRPSLARALDHSLVFQEELGNVKTVSAPAAAPIRCETSRGRDRISVLPRCGIQPPEGGRYPWPASPGHTKHIECRPLRAPPEIGSPPCQPRCGEGPGRPSQDVSAPAGFSGNRSLGNPRFARRPLSRSQVHSADCRHAVSVTPLHPICDESS